MIEALRRRVEAALATHGNLGATLIKSAAGTAGVRVAQGVLGLLTAMVLAKLLGPSGYGTYAFVMALIGFIAIPSELGIPGLAVREIAASNARKDWGHMRGFIIRSHQMVGVVSLSLVALGATGLWLWGHGINPTRLKCMWLALLLVPLISLGALRGAMLRGLRKVVQGLVPEQVIRPAALLVVVSALYAAGHAIWTPVEVMLAQIIAVSAAFASGLYLYLRSRPTQLALATPRFKSTTTWLRSSIPFGLSAAMYLVNGRTDILVLGAFHDDAEIGVYRVAVQLATLIIFAQQAVNLIQGPHVAHLYTEGNLRTLQKMITKSSRAIFVFSLTIVGGLVVLGKPIINLAFGERYVDAYWPLVILGIGQLVNASMGSVANVLNMTGHELDTTRIILAGAAMNVVLNFALTPRFGMVGAAVATACSLVTWNVMMWSKAYQRTGIETSPLIRRSARR